MGIGLQVCFAAHMHGMHPERGMVIQGGRQANVVIACMHMERACVNACVRLGGRLYVAQTLRDMAACQQADSELKIAGCTWEGNVYVYHRPCGAYLHANRWVLSWRSLAMAARTTFSSWTPLSTPGNASL